LGKPAEQNRTDVARRARRRLCVRSIGYKQEIKNRTRANNYKKNMVNNLVSKDALNKELISDMCTE
jgi:hypothetical protein